jgi:microcin C transport system substrate-binding protein
MEKKIQSAFQLSRFYLILGLALAVFSMNINISECRAAHGISIDGKLKYTPDFKQFDYTSEQAKKGGALVLHDLGSYDKMNPFTLKGSAPSGLDNLVFETLAVSSLDEPFAGYGLIAKDIELAKTQDSLTTARSPRKMYSFRSIP